MAGRSCFGPWALVALTICAWVPPALAQRSYRTENVTYQNGEDATYLTATLYLPRGDGPFAGAVLMSIAGADELVEHLTGLGYAVLIPIRRGFVAVEPLLQATYRDLTEDGQAAVDYLRARPDVDDARVSLIGQGDDAGPALMAAGASPTPIPLVLLAPPAFPGPEVFRLEQRSIAVNQGWRAPQLEALDRYIARIADLVLDERSPYLKEYRLEELVSTSEVQLPYNAAFPTGADQPHFFASPLWHDRLALQPEDQLARLHGPVLVLIGTEDSDVTLDVYLAAVRRGLARAVTEDDAVCVVDGRTRHSYTDAGVRLIGAWLEARGSKAAAIARIPGVCLSAAPGRD
jgi:dienelactone hydrolase